MAIRLKFEFGGDVIVTRLHEIGENLKLIAFVLYWSEFLATVPEVPGSIPSAAKFSEKKWCSIGVH
jgi:hypothetical protein